MCVVDWQHAYVYQVPVSQLQFFFVLKIFQGLQPWVRRFSGQYSSLKAALLILVIYCNILRDMGEFLLGGAWEGSYFLSTIMVSVGIFTLGGEF